MRTFMKPLALAACVAVGVLGVSASNAQAQAPVYNFAYGNPLAAGGIGLGPFYNAANFGYATPYLPSYLGYGSYYNYINSRPVPFAYGRAPVYGNYYRHGYHRHWHR